MLSQNGLAKAKSLNFHAKEPLKSTGLTDCFQELREHLREVLRERRKGTAENVLCSGSPRVHMP
jgi:hypothetical protein